MSTYAVIRVLVLLLVLVPLVSAALLPLFGRAARRVALWLALVYLGLTAAVAVIAIPTLDERARDTSQVRGDGSLQRWYPHFVPGDPAGRHGGEGADARTGWTLFNLSASPSADGRPGPKVQLFLGVDGLNLWLVALAAVMLPPAILVSWDSVKERPGAYYGWLFLLQTGVVGAFLSFDVILFYIFFELTLIPAFFLIGRWGVGSARRDAARKFFLYTLAGSLLTLLGVIGAVVTNPTPVHPTTGGRVNSAFVPVEVPASASGPARAEIVAAKAGPITFSLPDLMGNVQVWADAVPTARMMLTGSDRALSTARERAKPNPAEVRGLELQVESARRAVADAEAARTKLLDTQFWLFVALMAGFMVKVPVWPFHTWLPAAYGESPIGITVVLSALLSKLGAFGILRLVLPLVPDAALAYGLPAVGALAAFGIVYAAFCAYASRDVKMVIAYSSVSHLGFLVLGLFAFNKEGLTGAALHMVNHGLSTGALFAALAFLLDRYRTTETSKFGGLMGRFPTFAVLAFALCLASVGLPGFNNFVSEMMMMAGLFDARNPGVPRLGLAVVAAVGIFLSAWYTLTMMKRVFFNPLKEPEPAPAIPVKPGTPVPDVTRREFFAFGSLAGLCLLLGLLPQPIVDTMAPDVRVLANIGDAARARAGGVVYVSDEPPEPVLVAPLGPIEIKGPQGKDNPKGAGKGAPKDGKGAPKGKNKGGTKGPGAEE
ncbi:MAG: NADH-quinone oxidoreductase subunit M [Planctomycetes bacterium]|nr:NADH-quinone oxidoreductase subunit M [Planctomycetota bacterium]